MFVIVCCHILYIQQEIHAETQNTKYCCVGIGERTQLEHHPVAHIYIYVYIVQYAYDAHTFIRIFTCHRQAVCYAQ